MGLMVMRSTNLVQIIPLRYCIAEHLSMQIGSGGILPVE